jgi:hypothetical protein
MEPAVDRHVQDGLRLSVILVRQLACLEFNALAAGQKYKSNRVRTQFAPVSIGLIVYLRYCL